MSDETTIHCEHCGGACEDEDELEILQRGCRLKAAFPDWYEAKGAVLIFDIGKVKAALVPASPAAPAESEDAR